MITVFGAFLTSFLITFFAIPPIVRIAEIKHLFDVPDARKIHASSIPTLGGVAIFAALMFSLTFWSSQKEIIELQYILSALVVVFFTGLKDDLFNLVAHKKLAAQLFAAVILVYWAGIRINTFYGLFGIWDLSFFWSSFLSMFTIIVIVNSFNLIDGVNCLAGSVGILASLFFGTWFLQAGHYQYSILAFSLAGSLLGFLYYNKTPAKIFMGDTGSLLVGLVLSILTVKFIEINRLLEPSNPHKVLSVPVVSISVLIIPLFDTLRVFILRMLNGKSPLAPDKCHLHHHLLDLGLSHHQVTGILTLVNLVIILMTLSFQNLKGELLLLLLVGTCLLAHFTLQFIHTKKFVDTNAGRV